MPAIDPQKPHQQFLKYRNAFPGPVQGGGMHEVNVAVWSILLEWQQARNIGGDLLEIGVWRGHGAALLAQHRAASQRLILVDKYVPQARFRENLNAAATVSDADVTFYNDCSICLNRRQGLAAHRDSIRFAHIDGEDSFEAVVNDIDMCSTLLTENAILAVDGFFAHSAPSITEAVFYWLERNREKLVLFLAAFNKAYLCRPHTFPALMPLAYELPFLLQRMGLQTTLCSSGWANERPYFGLSHYIGGTHQRVGKILKAPTFQKMMFDIPEDVPRELPQRKAPQPALPSYRVGGKHLHFPEIRSIVTKAGTEIGALVEQAVHFAFSRWCKPGDVVVDGGAARGWHTFSLAKIVGLQGAVHAIEALPEHCEFLRQRALEWHHDKTVRVHEVAIGDQSGTTEFCRIPSRLGFSGIKRALPANIPVEQLTVPLRRLVDIVPAAEWPRVSFIKLDLEGGEFAALRGARELLAKAAPLIAFECGRGAAARLYDYTPDEFFAFFDELDYALIDIFGQKFTRKSYDLPAPHEYLAIPREPRIADISARMAGFLDGRLLKMSGQS